MQNQIQSKIKVAIIGMGNIGKNALEAALLEQDFEVVCIVSRSLKQSQIIKTSLQNQEVIIPVIKKLADFKGKVDVAILAVPTRSVEEYAIPILKSGVCTVDSFDIHDKINDLRKNLDVAAKAGNCAAVVAAGWDPGSDSVIRALMLACAPRGITNTNFGPGMSMGHSVAAKAIEGVADALSMTIPVGSGIHNRVVYIKLEKNANFAQVSELIKRDAYFSKDNTNIIQVDDINSLKSTSHGVNLVRSGVSGKTNNQRFEFNMTIDNPALTSQIMISCARAAMRQNAGCYTMIELPTVDLLAGSREENIKKLV